MGQVELPVWATRLREERKRRLWSQKTVAIHLRDAADDETRSYLPAVESIQRYVRWHEAAEHRPSDLYAELYCRVYGLSEQALFGTSKLPDDGRSRPTTSEADDLVAWLISTNTADVAISELERAVVEFAETHADVPPWELLQGLHQLHHHTQSLLKDGKQRLKQTRQLLEADSKILAHLAFLLGDLNFDPEASKYGSAALLLAQEAESDETLIWNVRSKTSRWQNRIAESADFARRGYELSRPGPLRVQLAAREANAAALLGDVTRARAALKRSEQAAESMEDRPGTRSVWAFPPERQALFVLAVATRTGDPEAALRAARHADAGWAAGDPKVPANWAQIRIGAGIAHLLKGDLEAMSAEVTPMLTLDPRLRTSTVTRYLADLAARLKQRRFQHSTIATSMRQQIADFTAVALASTRDN